MKTPPRRSSALRACPLLCAVAACAFVPPAQAESWVPTGGSGGGAWETPENWNPATVPNSIGAAVLFTNNITADATVTMTAGKTVGSMVIGDTLTGSASHSWIVNPAAAQTLTLQATSGSAAIAVSNCVSVGSGHTGHRFGPNQTLHLASDLDVTVASNASLGIVRTMTSVPSKNLTIGGGGQVWLQNANNANTGSMAVNNSLLRLASWDNASQDPNLILFAGNLLLNNATLVHQNTIGRTVGTGAGQIQFAGTSVGFVGRGAGNGVSSGLATLNLNNNGSDIVAGSTAMPPTTFNLNATVAGTAANVPLTVANSINLNGSTVTLNVGPSTGFNLLSGVTLAGANGIAGAGNLVVSGGTFLKVANGVTHTGTTTINGGHLLTTTFPAGALILQNDGVLYTSGLFNRTLGTGTGQLDIGTTGPGFGAYGGDLVVRLNGGTGALNASTINSLLSLNGPFATGQVDFQNPVNIDTATLTIKASQGGNACAAPSGNYGGAYSLAAALSGTGGLTVTGGSGGMVVLNNASTYAGNTTIDGGALTSPQHSVTLYGREGKGLTSANLTIKNGGMFATSGIFTRSIGTGPNQVQWATTKRGGFAAVGGDLAVRLNNGTGAVTVDAANTFGTLVLGSEFSTHTVDFQNDINTGSTRRGIGLAGSVEQKISGNITGTGGIQILGGSFGTLVLSGNNSFGVLDTASASDNNVVLKLGSPTALGNISTVTYYRGVLDLNGYTVGGVNFVTGQNGNPNGQNYLQNSSTNESTWGGNVTAGSTTSLFGGRGDLRMNGSLASGGGMSKAGTGKLTLAGTVGTFGANPTFTAAGGSLVLDYASNNANKLPSSGTGSLTLNACALAVLGNASAATTATLPNFVASTGANAVTVTNGAGQNATLVLNACSRATGGTVDFAPVSVGGGTSSITTTTTPLHNGLLRSGTNTRSGYATYNGGRTWATVSGGTIVGLAAYDALGTANGNIDLSGSQNVSANIAYNTLRFNGGASTLTIDATRTLTLGTDICGVLMTPEATGKGMIAGPGQLNAPTDFVVHQYNTTHELEVSALLTYINNGSFTKVGPGTLYMSNNGNTTDGPVYILGGTYRTDSFNATMGSPAGSGIGRGGYTASTPRHIVLAGNGRLLYTGAGHATDRTFVLAGDGVLDASGSGALTLNPNANYGGRFIGISAVPYDLTLQGTGAGIANGIVRLGNTDQAYGGFLAGSLYKKGSGVWTLNAEENIAREVVVQEGALNLGHPRNTLVDNAHVTVQDGATLGLGSNTDKVGVVALKSGSITGTGTLQGYRYDVEIGTVSVVLAGPVSALSKTTGGTVTLSGANTYLGDTLVKAGTLVSTTAIAGSVVVDADATLQARGTVGGNLTLDGAFHVDASSEGSLTVGGALTIGGDCTVTGGTKSFTIVAQSVSGTFTSVTPPFVASYTSGSVTIGMAGGTLLMIR